jgi:ABC-2 type transport system permease protein
MKRFWILTQAMFLIHIRNRMTLFWNMVFPLFLLVMYGLIFGSTEVQGLNYLDWMIPGVIVLNILAFGLMSSSSTLVNMRENGVLLRLSTTPLPALELVISFVVINILIAGMQAGLILLTAAVFFDYPLGLPALLKAVPMILLAILTSVALGQIVSGVSPKAGVAVALGQLLYFSQMFITDMVMPIEMMPAWLQSAARYLPGYAITQLVRPPLLLGEWGSGMGLNLLLVAGYTLAGATAAALLFRWAPRS